MLFLTLTYIAIAAGGLIALALMILKIGQMIGDCPQSKAAARAAAVTITTGFAAIGAGGVILIGAVLPILRDEPLAALMLALGFAALCLGLGFTHAVATLRAVVSDVMAPAVRPA
ncbi:MAG: hypothetical protein P8Q26_05565 [Ascidiaceihabitans sp.]|nr:hypothetical protein [Ascidiaceihabitans sp.]